MRYIIAHTTHFNSYVYYTAASTSYATCELSALKRRIVANNTVHIFEYLIFHNTNDKTGIGRSTFVFQRLTACRHRESNQLPDRTRRTPLTIGISCWYSVILNEQYTISEEKFVFIFSQLKFIAVFTNILWFISAFRDCRIGRTAKTTFLPPLRKYAKLACIVRRNLPRNCSCPPAKYPHSFANVNL